MGKLKRGYVAGSFVLHTVIIALLVLGPVLLAKRQEKVQVIDLIPSEIVDQILTPKASVNPPAPTPPKLPLLTKFATAADNIRGGVREERQMEAMFTTPKPPNVAAMVAASVANGQAFTAAAGHLAAAFFCQWRRT